MVRRLLHKFGVTGDAEPDDEDEEDTATGEAPDLVIVPNRKAARTHTTNSELALVNSISDHTTALAIEAGAAKYSAQVVEALTINNTSTPGATASG